VSAIVKNKAMKESDEGVQALEVAVLDEGACSCIA
jgi:hypothetical protein